jgi:hypothetical protein
VIKQHHKLYHLPALPTWDNPVKHLAPRLAVLGLLLLGAVALAANTNLTLDKLFGTHEPYEQFLKELKAEVAAQEWQAIADRVVYPLSVRVSGHRITLRSPDQFLSHVQSILTPKVRKAIEAQRYEALFANANGVMIGEGELWYSGVCSKAGCIDAAIKITAVNP